MPDLDDTSGETIINFRRLQATYLLNKRTDSRRSFCLYD